MKRVSTLQYGCYLLLFIHFIHVTMSCRISPNDTVVSIEALSTGCLGSRTPNSSVKINGKECRNLSKTGVNLLIISPDRTLKRYSINTPLISLRRRIRVLKYFEKNALQNGSVVVIVSQNACFLNYANWPNMIKYAAKLNVGHFEWNSHFHTGLMIGCHGYCPDYVISGKLPFTKLSRDDDELKYNVDFVLPGYNGSHLMTTTTEKPEDKGRREGEKGRTMKDQSTMKLIIIIAPIAIILLFVCVITMACIRKHRGSIFGSCKKRLSADSPCQEDIEPDELSGMYAGLNMKRPSALPNTYEALQKMSVQYEKIDSPLVFKMTENKPSLSEIEESIYQPASDIAPPHRLRTGTELSYSPRLRTSTELSVVSVGLGSSQNIFRKISAEVLSLNPKNPTDDEDESDTRFANYLELEDSVIYKAPSSVPKFEAPKSIPQNIERDSYVEMEEACYEDAEADNIYAPLEASSVGGNDENAAGEVYEQLVFT
ncbi:uncharacterized protein [Clytia hemisphaerica]|uniref:Cnidarian restricted protein n=2 Tax=Clytia hemisphaerica TaxID=252671 RepID=A0A7M5X2Q0_9CNID